MAQVNIPSEAFTMSIHYKDLSADVRREMLEELQFDIDKGTLNLSKRFTTEGEVAWPSLFRDAIQNYSDEWLAQQIRGNHYMKAFETRMYKNGPKEAAVPITAADTFSEGEFNRFYIRGLCKYAMSLGEADVKVYRGKAVENPRVESEQKIGKFYNVEKLLADLRTTPGVDTVLGLPNGPNSGLSVQRVITE